MFRNRQVYPTGKDWQEKASFAKALELFSATTNIQHVIAGERLEDLGGETYDSVDPNNTNFIVAKAPKHGLASPFERERLNAKLVKVAAAQERWWKVPHEKRIELLEALADILVDRQWLFLAAMALEGGKRPFPNGFGEFREMPEFVRSNAELAKRLYSERSVEVPKFMGDVNGIQYRPKGPIVDIEPFNFAGAIPCDKISSAIVTGNAIVMKASGHTPLQGYLLYEAIQDAFDAVKLENNGVVNFLSGHGGEMATFLLTHPLMNAFTFTGSRDAFWQIQRNVMSEPRPHGGIMQMIAAETSGRNAMVVCPSADIDRAVDFAVKSLINNNGQTCSHLGDLVLHENIEQKFMDKFIPAMEAVKYGDIKDLDKQCGALISKANVDRYEEIVQKQIDKKLVGLVWQKKIANNPHAFDFAPRIMRMNQGTRRYVGEYEAAVKTVRDTEIFAPAVTTWTFRDKYEAKRILEASMYRLTGTVHTREAADMLYYIREVRFAGQLYINGGTTGAVVGQGFGGDALSASSGDGVGASTLQSLGKYVSMDNVAVYIPSDMESLKRQLWHIHLAEIMSVSPPFDA